MRLSNKSTFSLVFSVLLVALFAFIATPAMAQVTATVVGAEAGMGVKVTITFSENLSPTLKKADLTDAAGDALADGIVFSSGNDKTYTLTNTAATATAIAFRISGYALVTVTKTATVPVVLSFDPLYLAGRGYGVVIRGAEIPTFGVNAFQLYQRVPPQ